MTIHGPPLDVRPLFREERRKLLQLPVRSNRGYSDAMADSSASAKAAAATFQKTRSGG